MQPAWSPILVQTIAIHALGFVLRRLQLNRHGGAEVRPHTHDHAQLILYLSGEGRQEVNGRRRRARAGDLFLIPPRLAHGFDVVGRSRPVCLVLDYDSSRTPRRARHRRVPPERLGELQRLLFRIPAKGRLRLADYPAVLSVIAQLLEPGPVDLPAERPPRLLAEVQDRIASRLPLSRIAREAGFHPDALTRRLKRETGLGLRALRHQARIEAAAEALRRLPNIAAAADACGFEDPSYFTRWFRRQTGRTPSAWRRGPAA